MRKSILSFALVLALVPAWAQQPAPPAKSNVYTAGSHASTKVPVSGDFFAFGGRVTVDQPVGGDLMGSGGTIDVRAPIGDDVRIAGGNITIESPVGGELMTAGGDITLGKGANIAGHALIYAGEITIDGIVQGPLHAAGGHITINGEVGGNVNLEGDDIQLGPNAKIGGTFTYASPNELKKADGAVIAGEVKHEAKASRREREREPRTLMGSLVRGATWYVVLVACAALFLLVFPVFSEQAANRVRAMPWQSFGVGLLTLVAVPVAAVLLCITILGIPIAALAMIAYPFVLLGGYLLVALFLAHLLAQALKREGPLPYAQVMGFVALTLLILMVVGKVPVLGKLAVFLLSMAGVGAFVSQALNRWKTRRPATAQGFTP